MKQCGSCKKVKRNNCFHKSAAFKDGLNTVCKRCRNQINVLYRLRKKHSSYQYKLPLNALTYDFKQFLYFLSIPYNKEKVYQESKSNLSFSEEMLLIQMNRNNGNDWNLAA